MNDRTLVSVRNQGIRAHRWFVAFVAAMWLWACTPARAQCEGRWLTTPHPPSSSVNTVMGYNGEMLVGSTLGIHRWNGFEWRAFPGGLTGNVTALHAQEMRLYAAATNVTTRVFQWDGSTWHALGGEPLAEPIIAISVFGDEVFAASRRWVYHWRSGQWVQLPPLPPPPDYPFSGVTINDMIGYQGELYVAGYAFIIERGASTGHVNVWNTETAAWDTAVFINHGSRSTPHRANTLFAHPESGLWVGGNIHSTIASRFGRRGLLPTMPSYIANDTYGTECFLIDSHGEMILGGRFRLGFNVTSHEIMRIRNNDWQVFPRLPSGIPEVVFRLTNFQHEVWALSYTLAFGNTRLNRWTDHNVPYVSVESDDTSLCSTREYSLQLHTASGYEHAWPISYQWRRNGVELRDGIAGAGMGIAGAATSFLRFSNVTVKDDGVYDCVVTNRCGSITSDAFAIDARRLCDFNRDGGVDEQDILSLVDRVTGEDSSTRTACDDFNLDGASDFSDVLDLANAVMTGTCR